MLKVKKLAVSITLWQFLNYYKSLNYGIQDCKYSTVQNWNKRKLILNVMAISWVLYCVDFYTITSPHTKKHTQISSHIAKKKEHKLSYDQYVNF